jgi:hypothetical protein
LEARQLFRSTAAHNCLTVNGESSSIPGGAFSWKSMANARLLEWREDADSVFFRGTHDGFARFGVSYEREILLTKRGSISLTDSIKSVELNTYELNFILSQSVEAEINNESVAIFCKKNRDRALLSIYTNLIADRVGAEGFWKIENCWVSPRYGTRVESKKLVFTARIKGNFQICNVFNTVIAETLNT